MKSAAEALKALMDKEEEQHTDGDDCPACESLKRAFTAAELNIPISSLEDCDHDWASYEGLLEKFDYCKKCDEKR